MFQEGSGELKDRLPAIVGKGDTDLRGGEVLEDCEQGY